MEVRILKDLRRPALRTCDDSKEVRGARNTNVLEVRVIKGLRTFSGLGSKPSVSKLTTSPTPGCFVQRVRNRLKTRELSFLEVQESAQVVENNRKLSGVGSAGCKLLAKVAANARSGTFCLSESDWDGWTGLEGGVRRTAWPRPMVGVAAREDRARQSRLL
jgi:hypothetical protein